MPVESQEIPNAEAQRVALVDRLNEVTGKAYSLLSEVLSFFPEKAKLFIRTQEYAQQIEGKKEGIIYYMVRHKQKSDGLNGDKPYDPGNTEYLEIDGFIGEQLVGLMGEISNLRGEGWQGEFHYAPRKETVDRILSVVNKPAQECEERELIDKKALEVMRVTPEELELMGSYRDVSRQSDLLRRKAEGLKRQADTIMAQARQTVEQKYPRRLKNENRE